MANQTTQPATGPSLKPFEDKIVATLRDAESRLTKLEAKFKRERRHAEAAAIEHLKATRKNIEHQLKALGTGSVPQIEQAKTDIDAAAKALETSLDELAHTLDSMQPKSATKATSHKK